MKQVKRVFIIVLDSFGIGEQPDSKFFGDEGSHTLKTVSKSPLFSVPTMAQMGLFNIEGVGCGTLADQPSGAFARMTEKACGKDIATKIIQFIEENAVSGKTKTKGNG